MLDKNRPFKVFAGCKIVKGYRRSIVYDLDRYTYYFIPNGLTRIIRKYEGKTINEIKQHFDEAEYQVIDDYFEFLFEKEIIFFIEEKFMKHFVATKVDWHRPSLFTNAIIDDWGNHNWNLIFKNLEEVFCKYVQVRFIDFDHFLQFAAVLGQQEDNGLTSIEVILPYDERLHHKKIKTFFKKYPLLVRYVIYSSPNATVINSGFSTAIGYYTTFTGNETLGKQRVNKFFLKVEVDQFFEAQDHNIYFNKKVCLDKDGNIKMGIHSDEIFGNIYKDTSFLKIYNDVGSFKKYWTITKNVMLGCRVCEFRYMCAYDEEPVFDLNSKLYAYQNNCGYSPYLAEFSH